MRQVSPQPAPQAILVSRQGTPIFRWVSAFVEDFSICGHTFLSFYFTVL